MVSSEKRSTADAILSTLIKNRKPLNLYRLAKKSKLSHQRIRYALPKLMEQGLVVPVENENGVSYAVQKIHVDREVIDSVLPLVEPLVKRVYSELDLESVSDQEEALANNLALFIARQMIK